MDHAIVPIEGPGFIRGGMKASQQEKTAVCPLELRCLCRRMKGERGKWQLFSDHPSPSFPNVQCPSTSVQTKERHHCGWLHLCFFVFFLVSILTDSLHILSLEDVLSSEDVLPSDLFMSLGLFAFRVLIPYRRRTSLPFHPRSSLLEGVDQMWSCRVLFLPTCTPYHNNVLLTRDEKRKQLVQWAHASLFCYFCTATARKKLIGRGT
ncbi:MAG: hypothetical protein J3R72DRAFT_433261 [Linnemannia gamsii]|nr:MAG: hypothetical protein J3R72DRAFT_433261 [Linnemannia gamsii]